MASIHWIVTAAMQIAEEADLGQSAVPAIAATIEIYCPLERGVAYMPVPRCEMCRWWVRNEEPSPNTVGPPSDYGECQLFSDDASFHGSRPPLVDPPAPLANVSPFAGANGAGFDTNESFGCVQWEAKTGG